MFPTHPFVTPYTTQLHLPYLFPPFVILNKQTNKMLSRIPVCSLETSFWGPKLLLHSKSSRNKKRLYDERNVTSLTLVKYSTFKLSIIKFFWDNSILSSWRLWSNSFRSISCLVIFTVPSLSSEEERSSVGMVVSKLISSDSKELEMFTFLVSLELLRDIFFHFLKHFLKLYFETSPLKSQLQKKQNS